MRKWVKVAQSCLTLCDPMESPWNFPGQNAGKFHGIFQRIPGKECSLSFLQGIFPTQGSNPGPSHCRRILYQLSHKGSPKWELKSEVTQSCPTVCDPMDHSLPGSSIHRIFQARILEWVAISFSRQTGKVNCSIFLCLDYYTAVKTDYWGLPWWSRCLPSNAGDAGLIPGQGTKILHTSCPQNHKHKTETIL